jgi:surface antigen
VNTYKKIKIVSNKINLIIISLVVSLAGINILVNKQSINLVEAQSVSALRAQVAALEQQIRENSAKATQLASEADSLRKKIAEFDYQITGVKAQIQLTELKIQQLEEELVAAEIELERQKELLKTTLVALYKKGDASSFELLVGSQSFTQFVNEQEYLERLKDGIQKSTEKVIALKEQIKVNKVDQEKLLKQQEDQKKSLDVARAERQSVLDYTRGQESGYRQMANNLRAQQIELNRKIFAQSSTQNFAGDPNKGGYPSIWANAPLNSYVDTWGMYSRQCVSYTAFKVSQSGRNMPRNWPSYYYRYGPGHGGNARDWLGNAAIDGIPVDKNPRAGDVGVLPVGTYGHVVYVERVLDDGRIYISHYNYDWNGNYQEAIFDPRKADWYFIHF